jgi:hypothetical protein
MIQERARYGGALAASAAVVFAVACGTTGQSAPPTDASGETACADCKGGDASADGTTTGPSDAGQDGQGTADDGSIVDGGSVMNVGTCDAAVMNTGPCDIDGAMCAFPIRGGCGCGPTDRGLAWSCFYPP